jgi:exosortase K
MLKRVSWKLRAQLLVVLLCAVVVKQYFSTASVNQLRWILAPTSAMVEIVTGWRFEFESYAGYISSDRSFVIAASCAGVNFLITAFLMLSLRKLWTARSQNRSDRLGWRFIPVAGVAAYLATLVANTVRISTAVKLKGLPLEMSWLSGNQLHRFEGIFIYFGFLLVLFMVSEKMNSGAGSVSRTGSISNLFRQSVFPLLIYYAIALGIPLVNGAYSSGSAAGFWEHSVFVLLTPLLLILPLVVLRLGLLTRSQNAGSQRGNRGRRRLDWFEFFREISCDFVIYSRLKKSTIHKITRKNTRNEITCSPLAH